MRPERKGIWTRNLGRRTGLALLIVSLLAEAAFGGESDRVNVGGDMWIEATQEVGDVVAVGGNVTVEGRVRGDVVCLGGNADIRDGGYVGGDLVSIGGKLTVSDGATVKGDLVGVGAEGRRSQRDSKPGKGGLSEAATDSTFGLCIMTSRPPGIDGRLDDANWNSAIRFDLSDGKGERHADQSTELLTTWDSKAFYVAMMCQDREMVKLAAFETERGADLSEDDFVEISVRRGGLGTDAYRLRANPLGAVWDEAILAAGEAAELAPPTRLGTSIRGESWAVEMAVPWDRLGVAPDTNDVIELRAHRRAKRPGRDLRWPPSESSPAPYGQLVLVSEEVGQIASAPLSAEGLECASIQVVGNEVTPSTRIAQLFPPAQRCAFDLDFLNVMRERVRELGLFSDVEISAGQIADGKANLIVKVKEKRLFAADSVRVSGGEVFAGKALQKMLGAGPDIYTEKDIAVWVELIQSLYHKRGYLMAAVSWAYSPEVRVLSLTVDEGRISEIRLEGLRHVDRAELVQAIPIVEGALFSEEEVRQAIEKGERTVWGVKQISYEPKPNGVLEVRVREEDPLDFDTDLDSGFNRVEGLRLGLKSEARAFFRPRGRVHAAASYGFSREEWTYRFGAEKSWFRFDKLAIGADWHDLVDTEDRWMVSDGEASLLSGVAGVSARDYFRRRGSEVYVSVRPFSLGQVKVAYRDDNCDSLAKATDWSLFRKRHTKRANPPVAVGDMRGLVLSYTKNIPDGDDLQWSMWTLYGEFESSGGRFGGDFDFQRWVLDARRYQRLGPSQFLSLRLRGGAGSKDLPAQKRFYLGGIGTLSAYDYKEFRGERMVLGNAEYSIGRLKGKAFVSALFGVGRAWPSNDDVPAADSDDRSADDLVYEAGVGLTLGENVGLGPNKESLTVRWAMPLSDLKREGKWELRFRRAF